MIYEIAALNKPSILIPLDKNASRGDQILNAASFEKQGFSKVLREADLSPESLVDAIIDVHNHKDSYIHAMESAAQTDAAQKVTDIILSVLES